MSRIALICFVMLAAAQMPLASATPGAYAPSVVVASDVRDVTGLISWVPGREMADSFRVYGIAGSPVLLGEANGTDNPVEALSMTVPGGFQTYAVSGVKNGVESRLVFALGNDSEEDCIIVAPPDVIINCIPFLGRPIAVAIKVNLP